MGRRETLEAIRKGERIARIYGQRCNGIQIPILETTNVMAVGMDALELGDDDATIGDKIAAYVETVRVPDPTA